VTISNPEWKRVGRLKWKQISRPTVATV